MAAPSSSASTDYFNDDDPSFVEALHDLNLPSGSQAGRQHGPAQQLAQGSSQAAPSGVDSDEDVVMPPPAQPRPKRPRLSDDEEDTHSSQHKVLASIEDSHVSSDAYGPSKFGDFGGYMSRKRAKLQIQNAELDDRGEGSSGGGIFSGLEIYVGPPFMLFGIVLI